MLIYVAELSHVAGIFKYGVAHYETREATRCTAIKAPVRPAVKFCNDDEDEPAIAIEDEDTLLLELNSSPLDELSLDARHSLSTA